MEYTMKEIKDYVEQHLAIFGGFYDDLKIIDPFGDGIIDETACVKNKQCNFCLEKYGEQKPCQNCITARAACTNKTVVKYEYIKGQPTRMIAAPFCYKGEYYIAEMIKYVKADEMYMLDGGHNSQLVQNIYELNSKLVHDELTGIFNRRYMDENLPVLVRKAYRFKKSLSIIMCDIDKFKNLNDQYGHQAGDQVLKTFAEILSSITKDYMGWVARYGGEEFLCVLPDVAENEAYEIGEKIRNAYEERTILIKDNELRSTASFGVAQLPVDTEIDTEAFIRIADEKLYKAKDNGRNVVIR